MFGLFGPVTVVRTKRGTRITFVAGVVTIPLSAYSLYKVFGGGKPTTGTSPTPASPDIDLSDR